MYVYCNSYITLIGVHELHGRMHPSEGHVTILVADDPLSSPAWAPHGHLHPSSSLLWLLGDGKQIIMWVL